MEKFNEHTELPWKSEELPTSIGRCFKIGDQEQLEKGQRNDLGIPSYACIYDDYNRGDSKAKANAAFIVEACNNYYQLKAKAEIYQSAFISLNQLAGMYIMPDDKENYIYLEKIRQSVIEQLTGSK